MTPRYCETRRLSSKAVTMSLPLCAVGENSLFKQVQHSSKSPCEGRAKGR